MRLRLLAALAAGTLTLGALAQTDPNAPTQPTTPTTPTSPTTPTTPSTPTPPPPTTPAAPTVPSVDTAPLEQQVETVATLIRLTQEGTSTRTNNSISDYPYLFTERQITALLPYLREVRALSALTRADVEFYTAKISSILTDAQRDRAAKARPPEPNPSGTPAQTGSGRSTASGDNPEAPPNSAEEQQRGSRPDDARNSNSPGQSTLPAAPEAGGNTPSVAGGGTGGSSTAGITAVAPNPFLERGEIAETLNQVITTLTLWESNFDDEGGN